MRTIPFGLIGCGMMGREFASAAARWAHLLDMPARPEIMAISSGHVESFNWFSDHFPSIRQATLHYRELLANPAVEAVYIAVPHHLHREIYCAALEAGKHILGEKPFGIDLAANEAILNACHKHPELMVRCSSEFPFFPAVQRIGRMIDEHSFGQIIEVNAGFLHSSDLDPTKPINWKRQVEFNGSYGCMGDLGMHVAHVPLRANWMPRNVRAILSNIIQHRPDGNGGAAVCSTYDNATLLCETLDPVGGTLFPMTLKMQRIAPGQKNTWYLEILGMKASARWSSANPKILELLEYNGGEQSWRHIQTGSEGTFKTITGSIFEFGFSDAWLQMWASYICELAGKPLPNRFAACVTPEEAMLSHRLFTAALQSQEQGAVMNFPL